MKSWFVWSNSIADTGQMRNGEIRKEILPASAIVGLWSSLLTFIKKLQALLEISLQQYIYLHEKLKGSKSWLLTQAYCRHHFFFFSWHGTPRFHYIGTADSLATKTHLQSTVQIQAKASSSKGGSHPTPPWHGQHYYKLLNRKKKHTNWNSAYKSFNISVKDAFQEEIKIRAFN